MRGFTLLELTIAVAIVALLAGLAVPGYRGLLHRAQRQDAQLALLRIQYRQERYFSERNRYATHVAAAADLGGLGLAERSDAGDYGLSITSGPDALGYVATARALPTGRQAADRDCAALALDQTGQRLSADAAGRWRNPDAGHCWG